MSQDYSNRELDRMFAEIKELLVDIKEQTTKTNGRVTKLEFWKEGTTGKFIGATAVISFIWTIVWFYLTKRL
jgi:hypothetical protein